MEAKDARSDGVPLLAHPQRGRGAVRPRRHPRERDGWSTRGRCAELRHLSAQTVEVTFDGPAPQLPTLPGVHVDERRRQRAALRGQRQHRPADRRARRAPGARADEPRAVARGDLPAPLRRLRRPCRALAERFRRRARPARHRRGLGPRAPSRGARSATRGSARSRSATVRALRLHPAGRLPPAPTRRSPTVSRSPTASPATTAIRLFYGKPLRPADGRRLHRLARRRHARDLRRGVRNARRRAGAARRGGQRAARSSCWRACSAAHGVSRGDAPRSRPGIADPVARACSPASSPAACPSADRPTSRSPRRPSCPCSSASARSRASSRPRAGSRSSSAGAVAGAVAAAARDRRHVQRRSAGCAGSTPLGWARNCVRSPAPQPLVLVLPVAASAAAARGRRADLAAARRRHRRAADARHAPPPHLRLLSSPTAQALRERARRASLGWLLGIGFFAFILGLISTSVSSAGISESVQRADAKLGSGLDRSRRPATSRSCFLFFVLAVSLFACAQIAAARHEEAEERLETLLALPVSRGALARRAARCSRVARRPSRSVARRRPARLGGRRLAGRRHLAARDARGRRQLPARRAAVPRRSPRSPTRSLPRASAGIAYALVAVAFVWQLVGAAARRPQLAASSCRPFEHVGLVPAQPFRGAAARSWCWHRRSWPRSRRWGASPARSDRTMREGHELRDPRRDRPRRPRRAAAGRRSGAASSPSSSARSSAESSSAQRCWAWWTRPTARSRSLGEVGLRDADAHASGCTCRCAIGGCASCARDGGLLAVIVCVLAVPAGLLAASIAGDGPRGGLRGRARVRLGRRAAARACRRRASAGAEVLTVMAQVTIADVITILSVPIVLQPSRAGHAALGAPARGGRAAARCSAPPRRPLRRSRVGATTCAACPSSATGRSTCACRCSSCSCSPGSPRRAGRAS